MNVEDPIVVFEALQENILQALSDWHHPYRQTSPLQSLYIYSKVLEEHHGNIQQATNHILKQALERLALDHEEYASVLQSRYIDNEKVESAAGRMNISDATFHRKRNEALPLLTEAVLRIDREAMLKYRTQMEARLAPSSYTQYFGREKVAGVLIDLLNQQTAPWIATVIGMGGIGKTSLVDSVVRQVIKQASFFEVGWVTASQSIFNAGGKILPITQPTISTASLVEKLCTQLMPGFTAGAQRSSEETLAMLEKRLKSAPHLIVIDNLETLADVELLLPLLRRLANPTKFVLTTRHSLYDEPDLFHLKVPELVWKDALGLMRWEAEQRNIQSVLNASDVDLYPIFEAVGGNPLALRLVIGLLHRHPLKGILADLVAARGKQIEALYTHIYGQSWSRLGAIEQDVLVSMPLVSEEGGRFEMLVSMCELDESTLRRALDTLVTFNLIEARGDLYERRYTIHSLTRAFLHEQVIRWQQRGEELVA
ncbi:MAG: AAA family ATPase [Caldilineaceae bacterium]|nr:AAA family ATPase [Caldilineaceae bacterium]